MPSAVFVDEKGKMTIGQLAAASRMKNPANYKDEFKRDLGQLIPYHMGAYELMPEDLYKEIFVYFKAKAEESTGEHISKAYITYPANMGRKKKELIELAAKKAGLLDVELIDEPTAAAYCYCTQGKIKVGDILLVYDLGGGTFDVALIQYTDQGFRSVTQALGIDKCGGIDIDRLIFEDIYSKLPDEMLTMLKGNEQALKRFHAQLMELSVKVKHQLSSVESFKDVIPVGFDYVEYELSRVTLNQMIAPLVEDTMAQVKKLVKNADINMNDISTCILVGGTTRIPYIRERLEQITGRPVYKDIDPELAVCMGAAVWKGSKDNFGKDSVNNNKDQTTKQNIVAIDLGTSKCCTAIMENNNITIIPNRYGEKTTPTVIAFDADGKVTIGKEALNKLEATSRFIISSIMKELHSDKEFTIHNKRYTPAAVLSLIIKQLKEDAERYLGATVQNLMIAVPACLKHCEREIVRGAAMLAGLNSERFISDTGAVGLYQLFRDKAQSKFMVCDIGAGNFNVSVVEIGDEVSEVVSSSGNPHLGGDDFNDRIIAYLTEQFRRNEGIDLTKDGMALTRLREAVEAAKIELSLLTTTSISIPYIAYGIDGPKHLNIELTRNKFNELISDLLEKMKEPINRALEDAYEDIKYMDKIILVGGSSRVPAVQEKLQKITGKNLYLGLNSMECVVTGAAILGGILAGNVTGDFLSLQSFPNTLSIEDADGTCIRIIGGNTTIPTKKYMTVTTVQDDQKAIDIHIVEGKKEYAKDNMTLNIFRVEGFAPCPKGTIDIQIMFEIDANYNFTATAKDMGTGKEWNIPTFDTNRRINTVEYRLREQDEPEKATT